MRALCNNVKIKAYLCELGTKLSKLVTTPLNVGLRQTEVLNLLFSLTILMSRTNNELFLSISEVNLILACWSLANIKFKFPTC